MYAPRGVRRVMHKRFFPSVCAERGPVAETDAGTVEKGLGGVSLFLRPGGGGFTSTSGRVSLGLACVTPGTDGSMRAEILIRFPRPMFALAFDLRLRVMRARRNTRDRQL
jgi:hypothetical protein